MNTLTINYDQKVKNFHLFDDMTLRQLTEKTKNPKMKRKTGANLFTIEFSSSDEEDYYEEDEPAPSPAPKRAVRQITPTRVTKKQITNPDLPPPNIGGLIELSSSSYSDSEDLIIQNNTKKNDVFTLNEDDKNQKDKTPQKSPVRNAPKHVIITPKRLNNDNNNPKEEEKEEIPKPEKVTTSPAPNRTVDRVSTSPRPLPTPIKSQNWPMYLVTRDKKMNIKGRRIMFALFEGSNQLYSAKCKSNNPKSVFIMKGSKIKHGETADALILVGNNSSDFSLRKNINSGDEIMSVRFAQPKISNTFRKMNIIFFAPKEGTPARLRNKNPALNLDGNPEYDFEGRFAIESTKNTILVPQNDGPNMLLIRKTGKDAIEIEARFEHDSLWIFTAGIASFLSKVK